MKGKSRQGHHCYTNIEEGNLNITKDNEMDVLVSKESFQKWSLYGHFDFPLIPKEFRDKSIIEGRDQVFY